MLHVPSAGETAIGPDEATADDNALPPASSRSTITVVPAATAVAEVRAEFLTTPYRPARVAQEPALTFALVSTGATTSRV